MRDAAGLGFEVVTAGRAQALEVSEHRPDLVILDLTMPHMDGEQAFRNCASWTPARG